MSSPETPAPTLAEQVAAVEAAVFLAQYGQPPVATTAAALAAAAETLRACQWRPIAEAPRDGTVILVPGGIAHWHGECWKTLTGYEYPGKPIQWPVTHWIPLPLPPTPEP